MNEIDRISTDVAKSDLSTADNHGAGDNGDFEKALIAIAVVLLVCGIGAGMLNALKAAKWLLGSGVVGFIWILYRRLACQLDEKITEAAKGCTEEDLQFTREMVEKNRTRGSATDLLLSFDHSPLDIDIDNPWRFGSQDN